MPPLDPNLMLQAGPYGLLAMLFAQTVVHIANIVVKHRETLAQQRIAAVNDTHAARLAELAGKIERLEGQVNGGRQDDDESDEG